MINDEWAGDNDDEAADDLLTDREEQAGAGRDLRQSVQDYLLY